ncbi:hypothetical protein MXB_1214, partial [Myxobolus squamalis]
MIGYDDMELTDPQIEPWFNISFTSEATSLDLEVPDSTHTQLPVIIWETELCNLRYIYDVIYKLPKCS